MIPLQTLSAHCPVLVIGAAIGDVMLALERLPSSGADVTARELDRQIGGSGFNVARVLKRLGIAPIAAIPVGSGSWGQAVAAAMAGEGLPVTLRHPGRDNGWCLALVENDKERTFITIEGCEQDFDHALLAEIPTPENALVYVSGYELVGDRSARLARFILELGQDKRLFVDFGPRIGALDPKLMQQLLLKKPILSVNRDELMVLTASFATTEDLRERAQAFADTHQTALICRFGHDGAVLYRANCTPVVAPIFAVTVADTIAAGDSHCAGIIAALAAGFALDRALEFANMVAAIVVSRPGSDGAPTLEECRTFWNEWNHTRQRIEHTAS